MRIVAGALVGTLLAGCSPAPAAAPAAAPSTGLAASSGLAGSPGSTGSPAPTSLRTLRLGASNTGATNAPIYLADALGYFADQGITMEENFLPSASEVIPAVTRGDLDGAIVGMNPATFNALGSNFGLIMVCDSGSQPAGYPGNVLVVAKQMADTIKGPADLRGKKSHSRRLGLARPAASCCRSTWRRSV